MARPIHDSVDGPSDSRLQRRLLALETLNLAARNLAAEMEPDRVLLTTAQEACRALNCERASVFQLDEGRAELFTRVVTELEIEEIRHSVDSGITGWVARHGEIANVPDPHSDNRWSDAVDRATGFQTRNILAVPLLVPPTNRFLGVIEFINKRDGSFDSEDEDMAMALGQHAAVAVDRGFLIQRLRVAESTRASLDIARGVQQGFMPSVLPELAGYETATWWFPNEAVGGDYCDVIRMPDGRLGLIVADVSGHGLGPALIMASVRAGLKALLLNNTEPDRLLHQLAISLADDLQDGRFITMVLAALDPQTHRLDFANAGHAPAIHYSPDRNAFHDLEATGLPMGVLDEPDFPSGPPIQLAVGDLILLCTDGIVEAMDASGRQFGVRRLHDLICRHARDSVRTLVQAIGAEVTAYYEDDAPPDDLTILALRRLH
jgi:phosphoserine phosphatase